MKIDSTDALPFTLAHLDASPMCIYAIALAMRNMGAEQEGDVVENTARFVASLLATGVMVAAYLSDVTPTQIGEQIHNLVPPDDAWDKYKQRVDNVPRDYESSILRSQAELFGL